MQRYAMISGLAALALVSNAQAAKVTNLDHREHVVLFESAGSPQKQKVAPGQTVWFPDMDGTMSLLSADPRQRSHGALHDDSGLLHGFIGAERTEEIPVDAHDELVIWGGGDMTIQRRFKPFER